MKWIMNILSSPIKRCLIGFLLIITCGPISAVFPPAVILVLPGVLLVFMFGEDSKAEWFDTSKTQICEHCQAESYIKVVRVKHYMQMFFPFPILRYLFSLVKIPYKSTYYTVCSQCLEKHVGSNDFDSIMTVANGGLATVKEISKEEYKAIADSCRPSPQ